ncbi:alpha/beta fold hydrolase [Ruania suaedae]|uniref:alpha/beta fold hydrolase n=1 Tax=Ruania suaedae TaxID=2897774 RepID=UPI001E56247A|nr:alpha/beta fold hydrolase [Ruania suaedae]UFU02407.1 alpha/beta fold hydrolase [Ruania suaedae]
MAATVVLVHGIRSSRSMWDGVERRLRERDIPVISADLPGHGALIDTPFTLDGCDRVLDRAASDAGGPIVLAGLSLGGYLALRWAARTRMPVLGVVAASCSAEPRGLPLAGYQALAAVIARLPDRGLALHRVMARLVLGEEGAREVSAGGVALDAMVPALRAMRDVRPLADLARLEVPVWLVNGGWDHFRFDERRFAAAAPLARLVRVPRAGHIVSVDQPEILARLIHSLTVIVSR